MKTHHHKMRNFLSFLTGSLIISGISACDDFVAINPPQNQIVSETVFLNDGTATSAIAGLYSEMSRSSGFAGGGVFSVTRLAGMAADELLNYQTSSVDINQFYTNTVSAENGILAENLWAQPYRYIYYTNAILEGIKNNKNISPIQAERLEGEAKFIRAFCHFYLINLFGDVPVVTTTDYRVNLTAPNSSIQEVYGQVIQDLKDAQSLLSESYLQTNNTKVTVQRVRVNRWAATALLARVYLYTQQWSEAVKEATAVISHEALYQLTALDSVFLKNSKEAIWQLMPVSTGNTQEGRMFVLSFTPVYVSLSGEIVDVFEADDQRKSYWVDSLEAGGQIYHYPTKYQDLNGAPVTEYSMVLRLAEQHLIRAEANTHLNELALATADINRIRHRAGLGGISQGSQAEILMAIERERMAELFTEWGHRWFDLKRTGQAIAVLTGVKPGLSANSDLSFPIPKIQTNLNPLIK